MTSWASLQRILRWREDTRLNSYIFWLIHALYQYFSVDSSLPDIFAQEIVRPCLADIQMLCNLPG